MRDAHLACRRLSRRDVALLHVDAGRVVHCYEIRGDARAVRARLDDIVERLYEGAGDSASGGEGEWVGDDCCRWYRVPCTSHGEAPPVYGGGPISFSGYSGE